jgi:hypothetical protein
MTRRARSSQPTYVLILRVESPATDVVHRLRRALKFMLRVCRLRCISIEERTNTVRTSGVPGEPLT